MVKHKKTRLRIKNPKRLLLCIVLLIAIIIIVSSKNNSIKKKENLSIIINNEDVTKQFKSEVIIKDGVEYFEFDDIKKCVGENIYKEDDKIITISSKKVAMIEIGKKEIEINGSKVTINKSAFKEGKKTYLPVSELKNAYDIEFEYIQEYNNIVISEYSKKLEKANTKNDILVKEEVNNSSANIEKVKKGNWVAYISEQGKWAKIRTQNGNIGYIKKNQLTDFAVVREDLKEDEVTENISYKKDITQKNISKYSNRIKVINEILKSAVNDKKTAIKIVYSKKETDAYNRFKMESKAMLKECGITVVFSK